MEATLSEQQNEVNEWIRFGMRLGVSSALHPFEYAKVLIQIGYEPIAPHPGRTIFGQPTLILPNIFQYAAYVRRVDGFSGCFRGLFPKLLGSIVSSYGSEKIADKLGLAVVEETKDAAEISDEQAFKNFEQQLKRDLVVHVSGIIITQPFHVISVRMMAQFVGRETTYSTLLSSILEIYREEGIFGFFSGIFPKLLCDISCLVLASATTYAVNKYIIKDRESRHYFASFTQFIFSSIFYPLQVVATCMAVTGSRLMAGRPPQMPCYINWTDCWRDLKSNGELKRGSSLFWRYYRAPSGVNRFSMSYAPLPEVAKYK